MRIVYSRVVTFIVSFVLWTALSFSLDLQHLTIGVLVAGLTAVLMGDMFTDQAPKWFQPRRYIWFLIWIVVFAYECLKANIEVACMVLHPRLPINPGIVKVKTILKSETGITFLANFITLTPGTFAVDVDKDQGWLYIHWINVRTQEIEEASRIIVSRFERILKEVFE